MLRRVSERGNAESLRFSLISTQRRRAGSGPSSSCCRRGAVQCPRTSVEQAAGVQMPRELQPKDFEENRRTEPRTPCVRVIDILPCRAGKEWKFLSCELTDCSLHGLGVISLEEMDVGQQFLVKLKIS